MKNTIILCAGKSKFSDSLSMIPVNGKPVIGWILDDLIKKQIDEVVIVARPGDHRLMKFVDWAYGQRVTVEFVTPKGLTILHSLQAGLQACQTSGFIRVILGDTLILDDFNGSFDFVYIGAVEDARRWCLISTDQDGYILEYLDKSGDFAPEQMALAGYYHFLNGEKLNAILMEAIQQEQFELSHVLQRYGKVRAIPVQEWYDFGHIDKLVEARRRLLQPRYFNTLSIHPTINTITKISENNQKLKDELDWYLSLPDALKALTPRIFRQENFDGHVRIVQEYYGYPTLAELYVYGDLDIEIWESILRQVMRVQHEFACYQGELTEKEINEIYLCKTYERLQVLCQDPYWKALFDKPVIQYNGSLLKNVNELLFLLEPAILELASSAPVGIIHGDFCFSNILFDVNNQIIRLIDPRGRFGRKGLYGDLRYDLAKLRHSISGMYDYIVAGMFTLEEMEGSIFSGRVFFNGVQENLKRYFDFLLIQDGYSLQAIQLIEGLLFISMLPFHQDHPARQKMFYLTGLKLLNEVLNENCC